MRFRQYLSMCCALPISFFLAGCSRQPAESGTSNSVVRESALRPDPKVLEVGLQARKNLGLVVAAARPTDYWRTISIPGVVADRPGISDRGVTSPAMGVVSEIHVYPGDTVRSGQRLVTLRLFSEYLQATQTQLFKASQEARLVQEQIQRLETLANSGGVSGSRVIEQRNELQRQQTLIRASRQELLSRGLPPDQIESVAEGQYATHLDVVAPPPRPSPAGQSNLGQSNLGQPRLGHPRLGQTEAATDDGGAPYDQVLRTGKFGQEDWGQNIGGHELDLAYEVDSLAVELGQTVQAGELLARLANHQALYVVGHAFKREATLLEQAAQSQVQLRIEFAEDSPESWPALKQPFHIRHLSGTVDASTRTFDFFVPLQNQSRTYQQAEMTFLAWRFRPGQRARIEVPVEQFANVFVLPSSAVVREGADAYVYRQNGDLFHQISVHILHEDRTHVILANDRSITPGTFLAQNAAAALRRVLKAQSASGQQPGLHVHADGTVHAAH